MEHRINAPDAFSEFVLRPKDFHGMLNQSFAVELPDIASIVVLTQIHTFNLVAGGARHCNYNGLATNKTQHQKCI